ncbi:MAG: hypothetical protein KAX51_07095 [Chromatiaceae bacterium]|nr:hypothetical protein [Chromatiaceae bacterium]MBP8289553.1 hypothetical protein [Chromatiaceae bacterium]
MFQATDLNRRNARIQGLYRILFGLMTLLLITPVLIVLATLLYKGGGVISFGFSSPIPPMACGRVASCRPCWGPFGW